MVCRFESVNYFTHWYLPQLFPRIDDAFRKPKRGMWDLFCEHGRKPSGVGDPDSSATDSPVDRKASFFCGDAAGRFLRDRNDADVKLFGREVLFQTEN